MRVMTQIETPVNLGRVMKLTALLHLRKAVLEERYEDCTHFIGRAITLGATHSEIRAILECPKRSLEGF